MAKLYFKVASDWEEVVRLRNEIAKLKQELKGMDATQSPAAFNALNTQLSASTKKMDELVTEAAKAGAAIGGDLKKKIFDASQTVNGLTERIIAQKAVVKDVEADVKRLGEAYRNALKNNRYGGRANNALAEYNAARKALDEEKASLFALTQEQANARLSVKKLRDEYALYRDDSKEAVDVTDKMVVSLKKAFAAIGGVALGKKLISDMIRVRGEFQAADTAIQTLLGSKEKADALMSKVREYAKISPLEFSDVTQATQMMLGFNIEAEKIPQFLQAIGDVSMGETQKFNSLTLAFSQMSAAGKLMGQDLNQMINAGFNPLQIMADKTGKSISTLKEEMSKGAISAEMVQQAFIDATSAGGKFYKMSENASKTINGQISMMQDAIDSAFNEIGQKSEGFIMSGIQMTTKLVENYETVGKVLAGLVVTYGTYRAALIANIALTHSWAVAARTDAVAKGIQTAATKAATIAQASFNAVANANPYVLLTTAVVGLGAALWAFSDSVTAAEKAETTLNDTMKSLEESQEKYNNQTKEAINIATDDASATKDRKDAMDLLINRYPSIIQKYIDEKGHLRDILGLKQEIAIIDGKRQKEETTETLRNTVLNARNNYNLANSFYNRQLKINNVFSDAERKQIEELRKAYGQSSGKSGTWASLREIRDYYKALAANSKKKYARNITENKIDQFTEGLGDMSTDNLKSLQKELERANKNRKTSSAVFVKSVGDYLTGADREKLLTKVSGMVSARTQSTYQEDFNKAKKDWEDAKKELSEIEKDKSKFTSKQYEDAKKRRETAEKTYKDLGGVVSTSSTKSVGTKKKDNHVEAEKKANDELLKLQMNNRQAQLDLEEETTEKKLKLIDLSYDKQKAEIEKKEKELVEYNKKAGTKGLNEKGLTAEQQTEIDKANEINDKSREKQIADTYKAEFQSMRDYLKEYGTFQQKKLAIAEEYAQKIKDAQTEGERRSLQKERDSQILNIEAQKLKANIDWTSVFGEFGGIFKDVISTALEDTKRYMQTDEFKNSDAASQKAIIDAVQQMEKALGGANKVSFKKLGTEINAYQKSLRKLEDAQEDYRRKNEKLQQAQQAYTNALKDGTKEEQAQAKTALDIAQDNADAVSQNIAALQAEADAAQHTIADTATTLKTSMDNVVSGLQKLSSGSLSGAYEGLIQFGKGINNVGGKLGEAFGKVADALEDVPVIGWIVQIIDLFKDGVSVVIEGILDAVFNAVNGIISDVLSGDLFVTIGKSLRDNLKNITNTLVKGLSLGYVDGINWSGTNAKQVAETTQRLTEENEKLRKSIDGLCEEIKTNGGSKSIKSAQEALEANRQYIENQREILYSQQRYHDAHHSNDYYWDLDSNYQNQVNKLLAEYAARNNKTASKVDSSWNSFSKLSPEEMDYIRNHNLELWKMLEDIGKYDKSEFFEAFADLAGSEKEILDSLNEALTQTTFDSLKSNFISNLMDMKRSAEDFSEDFTEMMMQAVLNSRISDLMDKEIQDFYDKWAELSKDESGNGYELTKTEIDTLSKMWDDIINRGMQIRDEIAAVTGYDKISKESSSQQTATSKGFQAMSQDTGEELNGRFTALQIAGEEIKNQNTIQSQSLSILTMKVDDILYIQTDTRNIASDTRDIIANSYLELQEIRENTGAIVKPIQQMQKDIAEVKRNTSKL